MIGAFKVTTETSSAANVRRIEAVTSQVALEELRRHDRLLSETARILRTSPDAVPGLAADREKQRRELEKRSQQAAPVDDGADDVVDLDGVKAVFEIKTLDNPKALPDLADRIKNRLGDPAVVVLGDDGRRARQPPCGGDARRHRARREGRRDRQGGGAGRRRRWRRPGQHGPGGRSRSGEASGGAVHGTRGGPSRALGI